MIKPNGKYLKAVLALLGLTSCKAAPTPSVAPQKKEPDEVDPALDLNETSNYRSCVGMLAYLAIDRVDVQYEVNVLSRTLKEPRQSSWNKLRRVCRYLRGTSDAEIHMMQPDKDDDVVWLDIWGDSDWAGDVVTRRSQSSSQIELDECPGYSNYGLQVPIAQSSGEAEFYSAASAASDGMYIREVLLFFGFAVTTNLILDSSAARGICKREGVGKVWHLSCKVLWVQQLVKRGVINVLPTPGLENKADLGTKVLPVAMRERCGLKVVEEATEKETEEESVSAISVARGSGSASPGVLEAVIALLSALRVSGSTDDDDVMSGSIQAPRQNSQWATFWLILFLVGLVLMKLCSSKLKAVPVMSGCGVLRLKYHLDDDEAVEPRGQRM